MGGTLMNGFGFLKIFWRPKILSIGRFDPKWIFNKDEWSMKPSICNQWTINKG